MRPAADGQFPPNRYADIADPPPDPKNSVVVFIRWVLAGLAVNYRPGRRQGIQLIPLHIQDDADPLSHLQDRVARKYMRQSTVAARDSAPGSYGSCSS
jgi:hypothetical protein